MQPNELDRKRIERALEARKRYRYVSPQVQPSACGYNILSPCCSRNVDPEGGVIDIARLEYVAPQQVWRLFCKDHAAGTWRIYGEFRALASVLEVLNQDPDRIFWQ